MNEPFIYCCPRCGQIFESISNKAIYCPACRPANQHEKSRAYYERNRERVRKTRKKTLTLAKLLFWISADILMKFLFGTIILILYIVKLPFDLIDKFTKPGIISSILPRNSCP